MPEDESNVCTNYHEIAIHSSGVFMDGVPVTVKQHMQFSWDLPCFMLTLLHLMTLFSLWDIFLYIFDSKKSWWLVAQQSDSPNSLHLFVFVVFNTYCWIFQVFKTRAFSEGISFYYHFQTFLGRDIQRLCISQDKKHWYTPAGCCSTLGHTFSWITEVLKQYDCRPSKVYRNCHNWPLICVWKCPFEYHHLRLNED